MKILIRMGWLNIWRNKRRTLILLCAMIVGLVGVLFTYGFMEGWLDGMIDVAIQASGGHVKIMSPEYRQDPIIENSMGPDPAFEVALRADTRVAAWSERVAVPGLISSSRRSRAIMVVGVDPDEEVSSSLLRQSLLEGDFLSEAQPNGVLVGRALFQQLQVRTKNKVVVMSQHMDGDIGSGAFRIVGVYDTGSGSMEKSTVFVVKSTLQEMLGLGTRVSEVAVRVHRMADADAVTENLSSQLSGLPVKAISWREMIPYVAEVLDISRKVTVPFLSVFYVAMAFGIINTLLISVGERSFETGVLLAVGMRPSQVVLLIVMEAMCLATVAAVIGGALGYALVAWFQVRGIDLGALAAGMEFAGVAHIIRPKIGMADIMYGVAATFAVSFLSALLPAIRASRTVPVVAMRQNR